MALKKKKTFKCVSYEKQNKSIIKRTAKYKQENKERLMSKEIKAFYIINEVQKRIKAKKSFSIYHDTALLFLPCYFFILFSLYLKKMLYV